MKFLAALFLLLSSGILAQELNCKVTVNFESLPVVNREYLTNFAAEVQDYMNKIKFTGENWDVDRIDCSMNIIFTSAADDINYSAQAVVVSQRPIYNSTDNSLMLVVNDNAWQFTYQRGQSLVYSESDFNSLTSFLDFYAYIIIGYDTDSYEQLGGSRHYTKAYRLLNIASSAAGSSAGWVSGSGSYSRVRLIEDLMQEKYRPFREAFYNYHYNGLDMYAKQKEKALQNIANLVIALDGMRTKLSINSVLIKTFFDSKHGELIQYLKEYPDKDIFKILKRVDAPHSAKYDEAMK